MSDVARKAGVSLMTVSRVINDKEDVSVETRLRVLEIIKSMDYRPSAIARSLATQQTRTIGLLIPDISNPFFADVTLGIEHLAYAQGYHVFLCNTDEDPERELMLLQSLEEKQIDGLILCSSRLADNLLLDLLAHLPATVLMHRTINGSNNDRKNSLVQSVLIDDQTGSRLAIQHLIQRGHHQIGFLAGPALSYSSVSRKKGYYSSLESAGISPDSGWVVNCPPYVHGGYQAALHLLTEHPELTAFFCFNDLVAVGALQACRESGRGVPDDLNVVGFDDIPLADLVSPTLTTCRVPRQKLGTLAVSALIEHLKDRPGESQQIVMQPELIIRQSAP